MFISDGELPFLEAKLKQKKFMGLRDFKDWGMKFKKNKVCDCQYRNTNNPKLN